MAKKLVLCIVGLTGTQRWLLAEGCKAVSRHAGKTRCVKISEIFEWNIIRGTDVGREIEKNHRQCLLTGVRIPNKLTMRAIESWNHHFEGETRGHYSCLHLVGAPVDENQRKKIEMTFGENVRYIHLVARADHSRYDREHPKLINATRDFDQLTAPMLRELNGRVTRISRDLSFASQVRSAVAAFPDLDDRRRAEQRLDDPYDPIHVELERIERGPRIARAVAA